MFHLKLRAFNPQLFSFIPRLLCLNDTGIVAEIFSVKNQKYKIKLKISNVANLCLQISKWLVTRSRTVTIFSDLNFRYGMGGGIRPKRL